MTQIFVESCVDFEVAHLSVLMVWRLSYPEIPTLSIIISKTAKPYAASKTSKRTHTLEYLAGFDATKKPMT